MHRRFAIPSLPGSVGIGRSWMRCRPSRLAAGGILRLSTRIGAVRLSQVHPVSKAGDECVQPLQLLQEGGLKNIVCHVAAAARLSTLPPRLLGCVSPPLHMPALHPALSTFLGSGSAVTNLQDTSPH